MEHDISNWNEALIKIKAQGKAPKKYGEGVYRFGAAMTLSVILPKRGWELIKQTKNYAYLRPTEVSVNSIYSIRINIPTKEQALNIALKCHEKGESWLGQIGEWPASYMHERKRVMNELVSSEDRQTVVEKFAYELPPESSLCIGEYGVWEISVSKSDGEFEYSETGEVEFCSTQEITVPPIVEGQELLLEVNKYERNTHARELCIAYYGALCQACNIDFETLYGEIGIGYIHVHHITPISQQGGEYEVDPIQDLIPLCPNCHAMVHMRNPPYSVNELKAIIHSCK